MNPSVALNPDEERELGVDFLIDSNQQGMAERVMQRLAAVDPFADEVWIADEAIRQSQAVLATARLAAERIVELREGPAYCYLAFHGLDGQAQFVKVGMTRHPEQRLYSMATGNPLDCLWVFTSRVPCVRNAYHVEQTILRSLEAHKRRGEWITVSADAEGAAAIARQLSEVARQANVDAGEFTLLGYTDGR